MFDIGPPELILILIIVLMVFGPRKLPEIGKAIGDGIRQFKHSLEPGDDSPTPSGNDPQDKPPPAG